MDRRVGIVIAAGFVVANAGPARAALSDAAQWGAPRPSATAACKEGAAAAAACCAGG